MIKFPNPTGDRVFFNFTQASKKLVTAFKMQIITACFSSLWTPANLNLGLGNFHFYHPACALFPRKDMGYPVPHTRVHWTAQGVLSGKDTGTPYPTPPRTPLEQGVPLPLRTGYAAAYPSCGHAGGLSCFPIKFYSDFNNTFNRLERHNKTESPTLIDL